MPPRSPLARLLALPVAITFVLAGCGDDAGTDTGTADTTPTSEADDDTSTTGAGGEEEPAEEGGNPSEVEVELLDAGAEPREPLRLDLTEGVSTAASLEFRIALAQEVDGQPAAAPAPTPALRAGMRVTVEEASDDEFVLGFGFESFEVANPEELPPETVDQVAAALEGFDEVTGTSVIDTRGTPLDSSVEIPDGVNPAIADQIDQISKSFEQLSAPFPEEEVGVGAQWKVEAELTVQGLATTQETIYTLVERDGDRYVLDVATTQTAEEQTIETPEAPDATVELTAHDVTGTGRLEGDLGNAVPTASSSTASGTTAFTFSEPDAAGGTTEGDMVQRQEISMVLTREG